MSGRHLSLLLAGLIVFPVAMTLAQPLHADKPPAKTEEKPAEAAPATDALENIFLDKLRVQHQISEPKQGYSISVHEVRDKTLISPTFQYSPKKGSTVTLQAQEATIEFNLERQVAILHLLNCQIDAPGSTSIYVAKAAHEFPLP